MAITQIKEKGIDATNDGTDGQFLKKAGDQVTWDTVSSTP